MPTLRIDTQRAAVLEQALAHPTGSPTPRSAPPRTPSVGSFSKDLYAVDLARDKQRPLHVPPMSLGPGECTLDSLTRMAKLIAPGILLDDQENWYALSESLAHGSFGNIKLGLKYDKFISQVWILKEVARPGPPRAQSFAQLQTTPLALRSRRSSNFVKFSAHRDSTPAICEGREEALKNEVDLMHKAKSPLAPHAVLRTENRAYVMLPLADTDLFSAWSDMITGEWSAEKRRPVVLTIARQLLQQMCDLHESGTAHRDIKPANIFLTREGETFLGDYGMAVPEDQRDTNVGTYVYLAPEALVHAHDKFKNDIFGVGALLTSLLIDTGYLWKDLWAKEKVVENLREPKCSPRSFEVLTKAHKSYQRAYATKVSRSKAASLNAFPMAKRMHALMIQAKDSYPDLFPLLHSMQHPDPEMRPSARTALDRAMDSRFGINGNERSELRDLIGSGKRLIRAAADKQALELEAKLVEVINARQQPRRNSLGSLPRVSSFP